MRRIAFLVLACAAPMLSGLSDCLYSHTIKPLTTNFHDTPVVTDVSAGDVRQIDYSYVRLSWSANALGDLAKENGFEEIYYADLETLRVLGIWTQRWARVYGKRKAPDEAETADGG